MGGVLPLHTVMLGDGALPPVLFVHGFPISHEMWRPAAERLAARWRCILPDLPGYGRTPARAECGIGSYADDLAGLLDAMDERRRVTLVGLSMGGIIALEFFRRHRSRIGAMVLCDTRYNAETAEGVVQRERVARMALDHGTRAVAETMIDRALAPNADVAVRARLMGLMCATPPEGVAAGSRALAGRADSFPTLREIDVPTLLIWGREDQITGLDIAEVMHREIRGSRLEIIEGAGHVPPMERAEEFARVVGEWMRSHEANAPCRGA
ncbi:MAG: alpha/beta hydrolase [Phycisphaerae bacterium]|nr:alpha/beta hydrolase [Phycisphaerae bacterium]